MQGPGHCPEFRSDRPRRDRSLAPDPQNPGPATALRNGACTEVQMRPLLGIILGGILTVGAAYLYDNHHAVRAADTQLSAQRPLIKWDVVGRKWDHLTDRARSEWTRLAG